MDLIKRHSCRFLITDHVRHEITEHYQEQFSRLKDALEQSILEEISVTDPEEVETFAKLTALESFGNGECACIAVALHRSYTLAIDDKKAIKQARLSCPTISIILESISNIRLYLCRSASDTGLRAPFVIIGSLLNSVELHPKQPELKVGRRT